MSTSTKQATQPLAGTTALANPDELAQATTSAMLPVFAAVANEYLAFRRIYYHEDEPSLATVPPAHAGIHQADLARLAESTLRVVPKVVKTLPILGNFLVHLEQVANLHSITERERTALHNLSMTFLHGISGGIQPWFATWYLASTHHLSTVTDAQYFLRYPWDALLYLPPKALAAYERALSAGDLPAIVRVFEHLGQRLVEVLRDPIAAQPELAFTGPEAEKHRRIFHLKTTVALALGAYLIADELHTVLHAPEKSVEPRSKLEPLPPGAVPRAESKPHEEGETAPLWANHGSQGGTSD